VLSRFLFVQIAKNKLKANLNSTVFKFVFSLIFSYLAIQPQVWKPS